MACYAALSSLSQTLEQISQPVKQITSLQEKVSCLLQILKDSSQNTRFITKHFEVQIRDVSFEAEDIIESHRTRQLSKSVLYGFSSCFWEIVVFIQTIFPAIHLFHLEFQGLEKIIDEFDSILKDLSKISDEEVEDDHLQPRISSIVAGSSRILGASDKSSDLVGLDEDLLRLKDRLTGSPSKLDIISIVGMGGIGKTSLAKNLYDDSLIRHRFDIRAWVVVSQDHNARDMLRCLLDSSRHIGGELSIEKLGELLYKSLKYRRYLIVIDDIWHTKAWDDIKRYFPNDNNGSRIILTTRILEVASFSYIHHLKLLGSKASWKLMSEKVFGDECCPVELEKVGKEIANSCKGLPLAIILIGGLLSRGSKTQLHWEYISKNVTSAITTSNDQFMEILSLSYDSLPHHLKACFLYVGVFPEDYVIFVSQLIKLWIAEGFIKPPSSGSLEELAEDYLKDLIDRNLIMVHKRNHSGGIKTCIIHDMLRELCVKKAQDEKFLQIIDCTNCVSPEVGYNQRRISVYSDTFDHLTGINDSSVRAVLYFCKRFANDKLRSFTVSFRLLRVLDALTIRFYSFPIEILELVHLRLLAFEYRDNELPASISKLLNLQTLIVYGVKYALFPPHILYIPPNIWKMPQLRHLLLEKSFLAYPFPYPFPAHIICEDSVFMENLQTLSNVVNCRCTREVFKIMPNLKKLGISYIFDPDTKWSSYEFNNFVFLHQLEMLKCLFIPKSFQYEGPTSTLDFAFPPSLKKLTLSGCRISWKKIALVGSLPHLEVLKLKNNAFQGEVWEQNEGEFSKLRYLLIQGNSFVHWRASDSHFPNLQHLSLCHCRELAEIPSDIGDIATLELIELFECSLTAVASAMLIQEQQQSMENDFLKVVVHSNSDPQYSDFNTSLRKNIALKSCDGYSEIV